MEDMKINVKIQLSALWTSVMFFYSYADVLGFYKPGNLAELLTGEIGGVVITSEFLVFSGILMAIPSLMIFLSLILMEKVNRWINIILGIVLVILFFPYYFGKYISSYIFF
ncbi:MAG: DUF6326 family protein [Promethearchaeota archaeon]|jgi:uncharacterized membrane protein YecN with MAPEG domain